VAEEAEREESETLLIESTGDGVEFSVKVVPGASREEIAGMLGDAVKVKVSAPAEGGKANRAVCGLIAEALGVAERDVVIVSGQTRAQKRIFVRGVTVDGAAKLFV
jgi:uncharacterized protein (TIGR00251 family)